MSKDIFELYPDANGYFETSDGNKFFKEYDAKTHAQKLKNKEVKEVKKTLVEKSLESRIAEIVNMETIEQVETALLSEDSEEVIVAAKKRLEELKNEE